MLPISIVQVEEKRHDADARTLTQLGCSGGQREVLRLLRLLPPILYWEGALPGFLDAYEDD